MIQRTAGLNRWILQVDCNASRNEAQIFLTKREPLGFNEGDTTN